MNTGMNERKEKRADVEISSSYACVNRWTKQNKLIQK